VKAFHLLIVNRTASVRVFFPLAKATKHPVMLSLCFEHFMPLILEGKDFTDVDLLIATRQLMIDGKFPILTSLLKALGSSPMVEACHSMLALAAGGSGPIGAFVRSLDLPADLILAVWDGPAAITSVIVDFFLDWLPHVHSEPAPCCPEPVNCEWPESRLDDGRGDDAALINPWRELPEASLKCTHVTNGQELIRQPWFCCHTCNHGDGIGCCLACALRCHAGHDVEWAGFVPSAFCDCFILGSCHFAADIRAQNFACSSILLTRLLLKVAESGIKETVDDIRNAATRVGTHRPYPLVIASPVLFDIRDCTVWCVVKRRLCVAIGNSVAFVDETERSVGIPKPVVSLVPSPNGAFIAAVAEGQCHVIDATKLTILKTFQCQAEGLQWNDFCVFTAIENGIVGYAPRSKAKRPSWQFLLPEPVAAFVVGNSMGVAMTGSGKVATLTFSKPRRQELTTFWEKTFPTPTAFSLWEDLDVVCASLPNGDLELIQNQISKIKFAGGGPLVFRAKVPAPKSVAIFEDFKNGSLLLIEYSVGTFT
jgi:hypothetical protein